MCLNFPCAYCNCADKVLNSLQFLNVWRWCVWPDNKAKHELSEGWGRYHKQQHNYYCQRQAVIHSVDLTGPCIKRQSYYCTLWRLDNDNNDSQILHCCDQFPGLSWDWPLNQLAFTNYHKQIIECKQSLYEPSTCEKWLLREVAFYVSFSFNLFPTLPVSLATPTCIHLHCISENVVVRKAKSLSQDLEVKWGSYNDLLQVL